MKTYVAIMRGECEQLSWVCNYLTLCGICAVVKNTGFGQGILFVDSRFEIKSRELAKEHLNSCTKQLFIKVKMWEVFESDFGNEEQSIV